MSAPVDPAAQRDLDSLLLATEDGASAPAAIAARIRLLLEAPTTIPWWIDVRTARRLLGVETDATVVAWADLGLLTSRPGPDGGTEFLLADVLQRRLEHDELIALGGGELTTEELRVLREDRPGANPWERGSANGARASR